MLSSLLFSLCLIALLTLLTLRPKGLAVLVNLELIKISSLSLEFPVLIDKFSLIFLITVGAIAGSIYIFSRGYISEEKFFWRFHLLVLRFVISILLLIMSPNLIRVLLGWDGLGITSYLLVVYFQRSKSYNAGIITALTNRLGDVLILRGIGLTASSMSWNYFSHSFSLAEWRTISMAVLTVAACTKRAQVPFSAWLPAAIAAPTPVSSLVHSSTLVTAGVYLIFRFFPRLFWGNCRIYLLVVGVITIVIAGLAALAEIDIKKIVALSTLSQLGVIITCMGRGAHVVAFFHLVSHAFFKALLFITVGAIIHISRDYQDLRKIRIQCPVGPATLRMRLAANFRLCGIPFTSGFYSKDLCIELFVSSNQLMLIMCIFYVATCLTAAYTTRFIILVISSFSLSPNIWWINDKDVFINFSILALLPLAVAGGSLMAWTGGPFGEVVVMPALEKLLTALVVIAGALLGKIVYTLKIVKWGRAISNLLIWNLPLVSSRSHLRSSLCIAWYQRAYVDLFFGPIVLSKPTEWAYRGPLEISHKSPAPSLIIIGGVILVLVVRNLLYLHVINFFILYELKFHYINTYM